MKRALSSLEQYRKNAIETATPVGLVVLLYEAAVTALEKALEHFNFRTYDVLTKEMNRTIEIIYELKSALRPEGGEITKNLAELYDYLLERLKVSLVEKAPAPAKEARDLLFSLLQAWRQVEQQAAQGTFSSAPPSNSAAKTTPNKPPARPEYDGGFSVSG